MNPIDSFAFFPILRIGLLLLLPGLALGAESDNSDSVWFWNLVIALIVMLVTLASAALPVAALRQWQRSWFIAAAAPLVILALWCGVIFLSRIDNPNSHRLWPFEIFSWAMLNMIYMVALMTYKRKIDKAREESLDSDDIQADSDSPATD